MSKRRPKHEAPRGGGRLKPEDAALWQAFSKSITPGRLKPRVPEAETGDAGAEALRSLLDERQRSGRGHAGGAPATAANSPKRGEKRDVVRPSPAVIRTDHGSIDAKAVRRLGSGRLTVDARIDLHGMRQSEAHSALRGFLWRSSGKGHRLVLVITGKGGRRGTQGAAFDEAGWIGEASSEPGVLRRQVPLWLREPEFAALVVGFTTAHIRHGGEGALYVQLRRRG